MTNDELHALQQLFTDKVLNPNFNLADLFNAMPVGSFPVEVRAWVVKAGVKAKDFDTAARRWRVTKELGEYPSGPRDFVDLYATANKLTVRFDGQIIGRGTITRYGIDDLQRDLRLYTDKNDIRMKLPLLNDAAMAWRKDGREARVRDLVERIRFDPAAAPDWHGLVASVVDLNRHSAAYAIAVLRGYIWQVKRRLRGDVVAHDPYMPVLQGPQGVGKGTLFDTLHRGLEEYVARPSLGEVTDPRQADLFEMPCLFVEELAGAGKADVAAFKTMVSRPTATFRPMATNATDKVRQLCSLWGDCNGTLGTHFRDPSGMRRFAPLNAGAKDTPANRAAGLYVTNIPALLAFADPLALWRSVDELAQHPLLADDAVRDEWFAWQEAERVQDSAEQWLREIRPGVAMLADDARHTRAEIYSAYSEWCRTNNTAPFGAMQFWRLVAIYEPQEWFPFGPPWKSCGVMVRSWKAERSSVAGDQSGGDVVQWDNRVRDAMRAKDNRAAFADARAAFGKRG